MSDTHKLLLALIDALGFEVERVMVPPGITRERTSIVYRFSQKAGKATESSEDNP